MNGSQSVLDQHSGLKRTMTEKMSTYYYHYGRGAWVEVEEADISYVEEIGLIVVRRAKRPFKRHYEKMINDMYHNVCDMEDDDEYPFDPQGR